LGDIFPPLANSKTEKRLEYEGNDYRYKRPTTIVEKVTTTSTLLQARQKSKPKVCWGFASMVWLP